MLQAVILVNRWLHDFLITSAIACIVSKSTGPLPFPDKGTTCLVSKCLALNGELGSHLSSDSKWNDIQSSLSENTYKSELSSRLILEQHRIRKANTPLSERKKKEYNPPIPGKLFKLLHNKLPVGLFHFTLISDDNVCLF